MKGCVALLVVLVVLAAGGWAFLWFTPMRGSIGLPVTAAVLTTLCVGSGWGVVLSLRKLYALRSPQRWRDGDYVGITGTISAGEGALAAPASGRPCVLYEYTLSSGFAPARASAKDATRGADAFRGAGMAPCTVTNRDGWGFRLVGFPLLAHLPSQIFEGAEELGRVAQHLLRAEVRPKSQGVGEALRTLGDLLADNDGVVRFDQAGARAFDVARFRAMQATDPELPAAELARELEESECMVSETIVSEGREVTVFGSYRANDRAIDVGSGLWHLGRGLYLTSASRVARRELRHAAIPLVILLAPTLLLYAWFGRALAPAVRSAPYPEAGLRFDDAIGAAIRRSHAAEVLERLVQRGDADAIALLLRLGVDPNVGPGSGNLFPLQQASDPEVLRVLLDGGAEPNLVDEYGATPLHRFATTGELDAVRLLLRSGARSTADRYGRTPLHHAASGGHFEIATELLEAGADPNALTRDGTSPLDEARAYGEPRLAELLRAHGGASTEVTADEGVAVRPGDAPIRVVDAYLAALHAADAATMSTLHARAEATDWATVRWDLLQDGWPTSALEARGFASETRATVRVRGLAAGGAREALPVGFALERVPVTAPDHPLATYDGWRIVRSWIEWGEVR